MPKARTRSLVSGLCAAVLVAAVAPSALARAGTSAITATTAA